ncbi:26S proteasome non-ATPase regulatory subunit 4 isoform 3-T3 [Acridotheres tristis]
MEFPHKPMEIQPKSVEFSHICMEISQKSTINPWEFHINPWKSTVNPWKFNRLPPKSPEFEPSPAVPPLPPTLRSRSWDLGGISVFLGMAPNPGICVQLALKHRQGKNHKMRIIAFVGSPVHDSDKDLVKLAKRLKKEKVNVDIINFGEEEANTEKLTAFITALNGKDGSGSHLVTVPPGPSLADALISSPILAGEGGAMLGLGASDFEFGVDPSADPELALVGGHGIPRIPKIRCFRHRNPIKSRISLFPHPCLDSPIPAGPGGSDVEFGVDPSADPELALVGMPEIPKFHGIGNFQHQNPTNPKSPNSPSNDPKIPWDQEFPTSAPPKPLAPSPLPSLIPSVSLSQLREFWDFPGAARVHGGAAAAAGGGGPEGGGGLGSGGRDCCGRGG